MSTQSPQNETASSEARNTAIMRRWFEEVWNSRRLATVHELLAPTTVIHGLSEAKAVAGPKGFLPFFSEFVGAFPDLHVDVEDVVAQGDQVVARVTLKGTHTGAGFGVAPTGRAVRTTGIAWAKFENGKVSETWNEFDAAGLFAQLTGGAQPVSTMRPK